MRLDADRVPDDDRKTMTNSGMQAQRLADLEGKVAALSGLVGLLIWLLRQRGVTDATLTRLLFTSASEAVGTLPAELAPAADRLLAALDGGRAG